MELQKILSLIPANLLEELAVETKVNIFTKKLQGEVMFKLLLHCIISHWNCKQKVEKYSLLVGLPDHSRQAKSSNIYIQVLKD